MYKVLIVDDEEWTRKVIKSFGNWQSLSINKSDILEAENGKAAIERIRRHEPRILITDMKMPGINGINLLKWLETEASNIKIIVVSGYEDFEFTKQAIRSRVVDYLLKPIAEDELNMALKKCVDEIIVDEEKNNMDEASINSYTIVLKQLVRLKPEIKACIEQMDKEGIEVVLNALKRVMTDKGQLPDSIFHTIHSSIMEAVNECMAMESISTEAMAEKTAGFQDILPGMKQRNDQELLDEFLYHTGEVMREAINEISRKRYLNKSNTLERVKHYINSNYTRDISLEMLAHMFYLSKEYICSSFKDTYGENIVKYINRIKLEKAKDLMQNEGLSCKTAAQTVGFNDPAYFNRLFKRFYGISPGQLILQRKQNQI